MLMRRVLVIVGASVPLAWTVALGLASSALADRAFAPRFSTNVSGDIAIVGNTLETCQNSEADCANARAGKGSVLNNNSFVMGRVDVDHTGTDSSSARLSLPAGARVVFAGLYYGARTTAGTSGKAAPDASASALSRVDLKLPGTSGFERLTGQLDESTEVKGAYGVFADVTGPVRRGGSGVYTVAGVQAATGLDRYAGWALVVAYEAAGDPPRNLTVFDGLQSVTQGKPALTIPVSGFQTPLSGPVRTRLGFVAYEGDRGLNGDSATLDGKALTDAVNPANNFFDSTISADGAKLTAKTPDYDNQLGFDAKLVGIDGTLANGATGASIALKTSSDQYLPQVITFATDLYAPVIESTKTVDNLTHPDGPARGGDTLRYTITFTNRGLEAARNFVAVDQLPPDTTYLPGSLRITAPAVNTSAPTDLSGDDLGEYDPTGRAVRFFLGSSAGPGRGGDITASGSPGDRAQVSLEVRIDPDTSAEREIRNVAEATFIAPTLGRELTALSSETITRAVPEPGSPEPADLALAQSETVAPAALGDDAVDDQLTIENRGPGDAMDVTLHDVVPPGATIESATVDQGSCSVDANDVTCLIPHLDSGGSAQVNVVIAEPADDAAAGSMSEATVTAAQFDPTPANDSEAVTVPTPPATEPAGLTTDLAVEDHQSTRDVPLGGTLTETITVVNNGPGAATGLDLTDALSAAAEVVAVKPGAATCTSKLPLRCTFAHLPAGTSTPIELVLRPLRPGQLTDTAAVSASDAETNYANNTATIAATVLPRRTAARLRIVPIEPVANAGRVDEFIVTAAVTERSPGVMPVVCVTLPRQLRLRTAPGSVTAGSRPCWELTDLISGQAQSFRFTARIGPVSGSGVAFTIRGRLTGDNFAATRAAAAVQVPPHPVACTAGAGVGVGVGHRRATIAC
jgi:uncharacterized repeat protein (TIGR01451 family)